jgi:hypothetical protein
MPRPQASADRVMLAIRQAQNVLAQHETGANELSDAAVINELRAILNDEGLVGHRLHAVT